MVDPRMAQATVVQMKIAMIAATRLNMVVVSRLSPPHPQSTSSSLHCQVLFIEKYNRRQRPFLQCSPRPLARTGTKPSGYPTYQELTAKTQLNRGTDSLGNQRC